MATYQYPGANGSQTVQYQGNPFNPDQMRRIMMAGGNAQELGLASLFQQLQSGGRTDPTFMNQMLAGVNRGVTGQQDALKGVAAASGLQNSGLMQAQQQAVAQGGEAIKAKMKAQDAAQAQDRQLQNLQMLYQLVIGPNMEKYGIDAGSFQANRARGDQQKAAMIGALSRLFGMGSWGSGAAATTTEE